MDKWCGKVALVTGAAGGIGSAVVESLVKSGMKVVGCGRNVDNLKGTLKRLQREKGELHILQCDFRKEGEILSMFDDIKQKYGGVDVCINAAGICNIASTMNGETEQWIDTLEVNVFALSICTREAIKSMKERKVSGYIVHMGSIMTHINYPAPDLAMYTASKHAVKSLTESLRTELRKEQANIRISTVSPGYVNTNMLRDCVGDEKYNQLSLEQGNLLMAQDMADIVIYMLSCPSRVQIHDVIVAPVNCDI